MNSNFSPMFSRHSDVLNASPKDHDSVLSLLNELKKRGNFAFQNKSYPEAEILYTKAIEICEEFNQSKIIFYSNRSASRCFMGKVQLAYEDSCICIEIDPTWAKGYFRQAKAYEKLKNYSSAIQSLENMFKYDEKSKNIESNKQMYTNLIELSKQQNSITNKENNNINNTSKKVITTTTIVKDNTKTTTNKEKIEEKSSKIVTEDDEILKDVRGYKRLADGRVTTFFHNEMTEETKKLIGDIAPKKVNDENAVQIKNVNGGSAWNQGNTFEEKDMTNWAKNKIISLLEGLRYELNNSNYLNKIVIVQKVTNFSGDAAIAMARGAKRYIFDFMFTLECELFDIKNKTKSLAKGSIKYLDMSSDCNEDYDIEVSVPERHSKPESKILFDTLNTSSDKLQLLISNKIKEFIKEYHNF